jgi:hypothetical protein
MNPAIKVKSSFIKITEDQRTFKGEINWNSSVKKYEVKCTSQMTKRSKKTVFGKFHWTPVYFEAVELLHNLMHEILQGHGSDATKKYYDSRYIRSMTPIVTSAIFQRKYVDVRLEYHENTRALSRISGQPLRWTIWTTIRGKYDGVISSVGQTASTISQALDKMNNRVEELPPGLIR